jgi:hypothetical protein
MASKAKKKAVKKSPPKKHRIPRQQIIPGVGDEKIAAIENAAFDYAEIRDERQALTVKEVDLKKKLLDLMHKKELTEYKRNGISVKVILEQENIKVRVRESEDDLPADIGPAPEANVSEESVAVDSEA